jgi:hypothetical protein
VRLADGWGVQLDAKVLLLLLLPMVAITPTSVHTHVVMLNHARHY